MPDAVQSLDVDTTEAQMEAQTERGYKRLAAIETRHAEISNAAAKFVSNPEQICDCGDPRKSHWYRCRAYLCPCATFSNPGVTPRALHPGPACPCSACFLNPEYK